MWLHKIRALAVTAGLGLTCGLFFLSAYSTSAAASNARPNPVDQIEPAAQIQSAAQIDPAAQIERFHTALMATARLEGDFDARVHHLGLVFDQVFDLERIARISAGASWRSLDAAGRRNYSQLLRDVLLGTYVARFDADRGQTLEVIGGREVKPGRDLVQSKIVRPSGDSVSLVYYLRDNRVFNVEADGVSDLSVRRADYASVIKRDGFAALLEQLLAQVDSSRAAFDESRP